MRLNAPKQITWLVALLLGILGLLGYIISLGFVSSFAFWFVFVALVLMLLATLIEGL